LRRAILTPNPDPPMTEFFLLGRSGLAEGYPETAVVGQPLSIVYGIVNREQETILYQVRAWLTDGKMVGSTQPVELSPGEVHVSDIELLLPEYAADPQRVNFVLSRGDEHYRSLHLWLGVEKPEPSLTPTVPPTRTPTPTDVPTRTPSPTPTTVPTRQPRPTTPPEALNIPVPVQPVGDFGE
jgi:hypothetical protein